MGLFLLLVSRLRAVPKSGYGRSMKLVSSIFTVLLYLLILPPAVLTISCRAYADEGEIIIGGRAASGTAGDIYWNKVKDSIISQSSGRLNPKLFIRGEIGPEETLFMRLRRNQMNLLGISTSGVSLIEPALDILRAPFLFDSIEEVGFVLDYYLKEPVSDLLLAKDLVMIDWMSAGWLNFYATTPILEPADMKNKRMRINVDAAALLFIQEVEADYAQVSFSDVLPSLQTGLIDGGEQSTQLFVTGGFGEYAPHFTLSRHGFLNAVILANRTWFEGHTAADQSILRGAIPTDAWYRKFFTTENESYLAKAISDGQIIHELTPSQRQLWRAHTADLPRKIIDRSGPSAQRLYDVIVEGRMSFARQHMGDASN